MKKELKSKWIAALKSGQFKQGRKYLCQNECYCCLGILCEIAGVQKTINSITGEAYYDNAAHMLSTNLCNQLGLPYHIMTLLVHYNDFKGYNFTELADYIEQSVPEE